MSLPFEPACLPLLPGSLPYRSPGQALEISRRYAGKLLAWPQLPQRGLREHALTQSALGFPGLVIDERAGQVYVNRARAEDELDRLSLAYLEQNVGYGALDEESAAGLIEMLRQSEGLRGVRALKGQCLGPISLALQLTDEEQRPLIGDPAMLEALTHHVRLRLMWQELQIGDLGRPTILCLDEPFLDSIGQPFLPMEWDDVRARIDEVFDGLVSCKALYAADAPNWTEVLKTSVELIVVDVFEHEAALLEAAAPLGEFLERDGIVGLGIVPADAEGLAYAGEEELRRRIGLLLERLNANGIDPALLLRQSVISTVGGLGRLEPEVAERALQLVDVMSNRLRKEHQLE